ncbi:uncharacterized protein LOC143881007 isoform X1 [Tasmannia lanceolata]|uniref:uncharacterized protein LOC143881007 isoform X1 n=1 Tax=Tasmannia lanceolata TaxID=3420 RepID=UPI0040634EF1
MNDCAQENPYCCCFHPKEVIVGICALCLKERLLILASEQGHLPLAKDTHRPQRILHRKLFITLPKVFALSSLLHRLEFRRQKSNDHDDQETLASHEDSFISVKFEINGCASWDSGTVFKPPLDTLDVACNYKVKKEGRGAKSVVEHSKSHVALRWRKRIGHVFQLVRWKRSSKANVCHVGSKVEGVRGRRSWIRTLTKRSME